MIKLDTFVSENIDLKVSDNKLTVVRSGWRSILNDVASDHNLHKYLAGQIPYFYRSPDKIAADFQARHDALEMIIDLTTKLPTSPKFQNSHCGEILCALYLEDVLKLRRLYSKLTLTTSENTNVHKMDGFFVDTTTSPYSYIAVEAKSSVLPTAKSKFTGHRHGILGQMIESLGNYSQHDTRFDYVAIRDNLDSHFTSDEAKTIKADLVPPGPNQLSYFGMAAFNQSTVHQKDDDFILTEQCANNFSYRALAVTDLSQLAQNAYQALVKFKE
jgi:hypothetical protein